MRASALLRGVACCCLTVLFTVACRSDLQTADGFVTETPVWTAAATTAASDTPLPTNVPVVIESEPEPAPLSGSIGVPAYYTCLHDDGKTVLYAFTNDRGDVEYRTVGVAETLTDGVVTERRYAWYEAEEDGSMASAEPIDLANEQPGRCRPVSLDSVRLRKNCTATETEGLFFVKTDETVSYYVYGSFSERDPEVFPALADGSMIEGALALNDERFFVSPYAPTAEPTRDGERYLTVFIGSQCVAVFLAVNGDWDLEHVFLCSTGMKDYTPRGSFTITQQYAYKAMSKLNGEMVYAQYSSRFSGHYLFHTVPSAGESKNYQPNGKRQVLVEEYEKLGTIASHGCVRMLAGDCYWIYRNCPVGTRVLITEAVGPEPPARPGLIYEEPYMDPSQTYGWDPTDPDPNNPYLSIAEYAKAMVVDTLPPSLVHTPRPTKAATPKPTPSAALSGTDTIIIE